MSSCKVTNNVKKRNYKKITKQQLPYKKSSLNILSPNGNIAPLSGNTTTPKAPNQIKTGDTSPHKSSEYINNMSISDFLLTKIKTKTAKVRKFLKKHKLKIITTMGVVTAASAISTGGLSVAAAVTIGTTWSIVSACLSGLAILGVFASYTKLYKIEKEIGEDGTKKPDTYIATGHFKKLKTFMHKHKRKIAWGTALLSSATIITNGILQIYSFVNYFKSASVHAVNLANLDAAQNKYYDILASNIPAHTEHMYWANVYREHYAMYGVPNMFAIENIRFWHEFRSPSYGLLDQARWASNSVKNSLRASAHAINMLGNTCKIGSALSIASLAASSSALLPQVKSRSTKT